MKLPGKPSTGVWWSCKSFSKTRNWLWEVKEKVQVLRRFTNLYIKKKNKQTKQKIVSFTPFWGYSFSSCRSLILKKK